MTWASCLSACVLGAIAPDLDMFYFFFVDHQQHHHHTYWSHFPVLWAGLLCAALCWRYVGERSLPSALVLLFALNGLGHMVLDTIAGDIWWFAPFVDRPFHLFEVPAGYHPWWLNFVLHWTFGFELALSLWAAAYLFAEPAGPGPAR